MKMEIKGSVRDQSGVLETIRNITVPVDRPMELAKIRLALDENGVYADGTVTMRTRGDWIDVTYVGPVERAQKLQGYFADVSMFDGSHLAMTVASKRPYMVM